MSTLLHTFVTEFTMSSNILLFGLLKTLSFFALQLLLLDVCLNKFLKPDLLHYRQCFCAFSLVKDKLSC